MGHMTVYKADLIRYPDFVGQLPALGSSSQKAGLPQGSTRDLSRYTVFHRPQIPTSVPINQMPYCVTQPLPLSAALNSNIAGLDGAEEIRGMSDRP